MRRFFVSPESIRQDPVPLGSQIAHHMATVLRFSQGDEVLLLDGLGTLCHCRIEILGKNGGQARLLRRWQETETVLPVHLLQGLPKGDKLELVLQKGTELGVSTFSPLHTERSVPRLTENREGQRLQRWQRIIDEAARQSQRILLPRLLPVRSLQEALGDCDEELRLMLWEDESRPLIDALPVVPPKSTAILVGPEGGFSAAEAASACRAGFIPVRVGPRIMRSETAGFAMATILQFRYGDLGRTS